MKQEIKDRLEKINNGEVPAGYIKKNKYTIPNMWEVRTLEQISIGKGSYGANAAAVDYSENLPTYLRITDIDEYGRLIKSGLMSVNIPNYEEYLLEEGDLIFARTGNTTGKTYLYKNKDGPLVYAGFLIKFKLNNDEVDRRYIKFFTETSQYNYWVTIMSSRSGQPGINSQEYGKLEIPIPPLAEQQKIASILSTWDKAIELKEKLIEEKKKQKKGLMQKLLTGEVRLPGFDGEWKEVILEDIFERVTRKNSNGNKNVLTISAQRGLINQEDFFNKSVASSILDNYYLLLKGEFAYNKSYSKGYPMGAIKRLNDYDSGVVTTLYICFALKNEAEASSNFFEQYFESGLLNQGLTQIAQEGGRAHGLLNVPIQDFFNLLMLIPSYDEQKAIGDVLTTSDKQIYLLEQELEALKLQKKGLMQLLLTGVVRVNTEN